MVGPLPGSSGQVDDPLPYCRLEYTVVTTTHVIVYEECHLVYDIVLASGVTLTRQGMGER